MHVMCLMWSLDHRKFSTNSSQDKCILVITKWAIHCIIIIIIIYLVLLRANVTVPKHLTICHLWAVTKTFCPALGLRIKIRPLTTDSRKVIFEAAVVHPVPLATNACQPPRRKSEDTGSLQLFLLLNDFPGPSALPTHL